MSIITQLYTQLFNYFGGDVALMLFIVSNVVVQLAFWGTNAIFLLSDITGRPAWLRKYKVQLDQNYPVSKDQLKKALKLCCFNLFVIGPLISLLLFISDPRKSFRYLPEDVPTLPQFIRDMAIFTIVQEFVFYYSHRLFHVPILYKWVHKKHHEFTAPMGIIAIYAHPIEHMTTNFFTFISGPLVARTHLVTLWIFLAVGPAYSIIHHSGYHLPFLPSPEFHDFHHLKFNCNYGTFGWLDRLHGTDAMFRKTIQMKRHRPLFSTRPIWKIFPEKVSKAAQTDFAKEE